MALSVQNKNFLALLHKLDIDVKQFPDPSFDGLFDNVPKVTNYFFNWFMDNITPDNVLTQSEQAIYFELEKNQLVPSEEEVNYVLSSCSPTYEELQALDVNYVKNILTEDLEELNKNHKEFTRICSNLESECSEVKKRHSTLKESINTWKKKLITERENCSSMNELYGKKLDEVKCFLLMEPHINVDLNLYKVLLSREESVFNMFKNSKLLNYEVSTGSDVALLPKLEEDLTCVEVFIVLSQASLKEKKTKIEILSELLQKISMQKSFNDSLGCNFIQTQEDISTKIIEDIHSLESKLHELVKGSSHTEIQKILNHHLEMKTDLNNAFMSKLFNCKDYIKSNRMMDSWLLHILIKCNVNLEKTLHIRKNLSSKLIEYETKVGNDITNLELRTQRFKEVQTRQHPLLAALKDIDIEENVENNEETLKKIHELISQVTDDSNFVTPRFRSRLQSSIKSVFDNVLCGPTSELLFVPIELLIKFQNCEERENELSQVIKRLANRYVEAKETISKSDRKRLLLWIDFLTNPSALEKKVKNLPEPCKENTR